jgi:hypothetical protein
MLMDIRLEQPAVLELQAQVVVEGELGALGGVAAVD